MTSTAGAPADERMRALVLGALGVVFGDIGTSPLYALRECFGPASHIPPTADNVLGILSLMFWALTIVISGKYVLVVMRADNRGEGGILSLLALTLRAARTAGQRAAIAVIGLIGAALFYGDSVITPAISVLSAVEGLQIATPVFATYVVPLALMILIALFLLQKGGTERVGALFGPIMVVWFVTLAVLGIWNIAGNAAVLGAIDPRHAIDFFRRNEWIGFLVLGSVVLVVTGGEALYADMGHFGRAPIRRAWFALVLPGLVLNYFGQGALILSDPEAVRNPFYLMVPDWGLYPLVLLSTMAAVIASQAVITGAFSVTQQAIQLGFVPRLTVTHTSESERGQIYMPPVNWALLAAVVALVIGFGSSSELAAAYGIAVTAAMTMDTLLALVVAIRLWGVKPLLALPFFVVFLAVDLSFLGANAVKIPEGGWFPLLMAGGLFVLMATWRRGREILAERLAEGQISLSSFLSRVREGHPPRVPGTAVFLTQNRTGVPNAMLHNLKHNKVLHERVVLLTVETADVPRVPAAEHINIEAREKNFYRVILRYGFFESPDVPRSLVRCAPLGLAINMMDTSFFLGRETLLASDKPGMARWRETLFIAMSQNAARAMDFFRIPTNRVVELGTQVEI
ncbi:MAG: potassium transporter Kup [Alphaproteobacteria bacterium]|nr:potassium transporter Kup [Alphaproteobacteria bacterium]